MGWEWATLPLLADEGLVDVGDDTTAGNGSLDQGVQLLVSPDGELEMPRGDSLHLQVLGGVAGQLKHLDCEINTRYRTQSSRFSNRKCEIPQQ